MGQGFQQKFSRMKEEIEFLKKKLQQLETKMVFKAGTQYSLLV